MGMIYLLNNQKYDGVENLPVIKINYLTPEINFSNIDYLLFTSKNGVVAVDKISDEWKNIPAITIGEATAKMVKKVGGKVEYIAKKSYGDELAKEIIQNFALSNILFFKAKKVLSNIVEVLEENNFNVIQKVVYETSCNKIEKELKKNSVFIFTSPSTIKCFFNQFNWDESFKAVAIGSRTASYFPGKIVISDIQTIDNCIKIAKNMI
jgi:uroporphyrinogen-III synthase